MELILHFFIYSRIFLIIFVFFFYIFCLRALKAFLDCTFCHWEMLANAKKQICKREIRMMEIFLLNAMCKLWMLKEKNIRDMKNKWLYLLTEVHSPLNHTLTKTTGIIIFFILYFYLFFLNNYFFKDSGFFVNQKLPHFFFMHKKIFQEFYLHRN